MKFQTGTVEVRRTDDVDWKGSITGPTGDNAYSGSIKVDLPPPFGSLSIDSWSGLLVLFFCILLLLIVFLGDFCRLSVVLLFFSVLFHRGLMDVIELTLRRQKDIEVVA